MSDEQVTLAQEALERIHNSTCTRKLKCECRDAVRIPDMELVIKSLKILLEEKLIRKKIQSTVNELESPKEPSIHPHEALKH